jgi:hypothetical protein
MASLAVENLTSCQRQVLELVGLRVRTQNSELSESFPIAITVRPHNHRTSRSRFLALVPLSQPSLPCLRPQSYLALAQAELTQIKLAVNRPNAGRPAPGPPHEAVGICEFCEDFGKGYEVASPVLAETNRHQ